MITLPHFPRLISGVLASGVALCALSPAVHAYTLTDNYYGGTNTYNGSDVIGTQTFDTTSIDVTRSGLNNDTLNITIHTWYAGAPGTAAADGTGYGSLFFSTTGWNPTGVAPYPTDTYKPNEWNYAATIPANGSGAGGLYQVGAVTGTNYYGATTTVQSYTTANGQVVLSNVNSDPITYPGSGNPGYYFRQGQAVQFLPGQGINPLDTGTWSVTPSTSTIEGSLTYTVVDDGLLGNLFWLSWAMTCANDVIQGAIILPSTQLTTPLPGALPLFAGGLSIFGYVSWRRKRSAARTA